ncbi:Uncharacterised protein [Klebsiella pneumoniae]|nr:Uncharacterised protein [Klebsiella pneumoniae]
MLLNTPMFRPALVTWAKVHKKNLPSIPDDNCIKTNIIHNLHLA